MTELKIYIRDCISITKSKEFRHHFMLYSLIFISSFMVSIIIGLGNVGLSENVIFFVKNYTSLRYGGSDVLSILTNNFLISVIMMYYFYSEGMFKKYFGISYFAYMGAIGGFAVSKVILKYNFIIALSLIVPHGIIEVPTIIYAASSGWALSELNKSLDKDKSRRFKIPREFVYISMVIFVLLGISGYIESNITPYIYDTLLSYYY